MKDQFAEELDGLKILPLNPCPRKLGPMLIVATSPTHTIIEYVDGIRDSIHTPKLLQEILPYSATLCRQPACWEREQFAKCPITGSPCGCCEDHANACSRGEDPQSRPF